MRSLASFLLLVASLSVLAQAPTTLADDLGYAPGTRLLIIHADDLGFSHSANAATFEAMTAGSVNSASIMMPTPWVPEVAAFAKTHPDADLGLHLTLTSEWTNYRWGPMARDSVRGLLDEHQYLHGQCPEMAASATAEEVARELRAQVEQSLRLGIRPTHLDTHMGCLVFTRPDIFAAYMRVGRDYDLPVLAARDESWGSDARFREVITENDMLVDRVQGAPEPEQGNFRGIYDSLLTDLQPGVTVLLLHCGYDDAELRAAVAPQIPYGAAWRQEDFDYFTSPHLPELLEREGIQLVTWRELWEKWKAR